MMNQTTKTNNSTVQTGLPGNFLKIFAALTMLFDHAALTIVYAMLAKSPDYLDLVFSPDVTVEQIETIPTDFMNLFTVYTVMRLVGRIAFPIFAFLAFEGFMHTSNIKRYLLRVGVLALFSEIPYNFVVSTVNTRTASILYPQVQNTVCTLFLGLLMLSIMKRFEAKDTTPKEATKQMFCQLVCLLVTAIVAVVLRTDYSYVGILLIGEFYLFRNSKKMQIISGCILALSVNFAALLAFIPIAMYNGTLIRSKKFQYFFYIFYPAHLLLLFLLSMLV